MRIGQLAAVADVSVQTIRFYERRGLIGEPTRSQSGYREYPKDAVGEIGTILQLKALGFTLSEIGAAAGCHTDDGKLCRLAAEKVHAISSEIRRLTEVLAALEQRRHACGCAHQTEFQHTEGRRN